MSALKKIFGKKIEKNIKSWKIVLRPISYIPKMVANIILLTWSKKETKCKTHMTTLQGILNTYKF